MRKYDDTRVVVFKEDYNPSGKQVIYKKGGRYFIHHQLVAEIEMRGAKMNVSRYDYKTAEDKAREQFIKENNNRVLV